jgi:4-hydroxy-tetrahydrodipicolinate reductase
MLKRNQRIRLAIIGAGGRLGLQITALAAVDPRFCLSALLVSPSSELLAQPSSCGPLNYVAKLETAVDVIIDVSLPQAFAQTATAVRDSGGALVCGVTGFDELGLAAMAELAQTHAVLHTHNFSRGVVVLKHLSSIAAELLGPSFDVGILDIHHRNKRDAPSGTALSLEAALRQGGARSVQHSALRLGSVVGEHQVHFSGLAEELTLTHRAADRAMFAHGALDAAAWLAGKAPGQYAIEAVFGIA